MCKENLIETRLGEGFKSLNIQQGVLKILSHGMNRVH